MVGVTSVALSVSLASFSALGQQGSEDHIIPLTILEQDGRSEQLVKPQSLRVKGVPGQVQRVELDSGPRRIVLLLDASGSMTRSPEPRWQSAIQIAKEFLSMLRPADRVALHVFAVKHLILSSYTGDFGFVAWQLGLCRELSSQSAKKEDP